MTLAKNKSRNERRIYEKLANGKSSENKFENNIEVSWEDEEFINYEATRIGPGEHGEPVIVSDPEELSANEEWERKEGFYVDVSNKISVNRSLPDHRPAVSENKFENNIEVSWEDEEFINYEATRIGPGEHGEPVIVSDPEELSANEEWERKEGFYVDVSNKISVNRSLPDHRPAVCKTQKYFRNLPNASVIVVFHNEIPSVLLRCLHSIYNRSPKTLLHEIVLVNDKSTFPELYEPIREHVNREFGDKVVMIENNERQGLIKARMTGAYASSGEVIIFIDSHVEVYNSWLPPLLNPLVLNPTFATAAIIDGMNHKTFTPSYSGNGYRGLFDWSFRYQYLPLRSKDKKIEGAPYELPMHVGESYAIRRDHFFYLGGYDEGLLIWNGENYELSLKLWLCSGGILAVPCSRVTHLSKTHSAYRETKEVHDFVGRNLKRVAEVWLDDYKQYFYNTDINRYKDLDPGDLTQQFEKKKSLNCKPFQYYLDEVAPEMLKYYPITPQHFANGKIQSMATEKCIGLVDNHYHIPVQLYDCDRSHGLNFILTFEQRIKADDNNDQCIESDLKLSNCVHAGIFQQWKFHFLARQISSPFNKCLTANGTEITLMKCDPNMIEQKWRWTYENKTALMDWKNSCIKTSD
ncbi:CLUMA_CG018266, isoform A [Clunio marinus]|uniref:Polypeptide N-acetylgalactosaminyltransferase n=1 Tax=Clunio marinus TaxID=568069 RepID=A0A1J1IYK0_9DIPT|nr:CLUMA_CG018266, isoform A [Clunio marinus]